MAPVVDLLAIATPLPPVRFPDGSEHQLAPFDAIAYQLWRDLKKEPDLAIQTVMWRDLIRRIAPSADDDNIESLGDEDQQKIVLQAMRKLDLVSQLLGNSTAGGSTRAASDSPPSSPTTSSSTSSAESGESPAAVPSST